MLLRDHNDASRRQGATPRDGRDVPRRMLAWQLTPQKIYFAVDANLWHLTLRDGYDEPHHHGVLLRDFQNLSRRCWHGTSLRRRFISRMMLTWHLTLRDGHDASWLHEVLLRDFSEFVAEDVEVAPNSAWRILCGTWLCEMVMMCSDARGASVRFLEFVAEDASMALLISQECCSLCEKPIHSMKILFSLHEFCSLRENNVHSWKTQSSARKMLSDLQIAFRGYFCHLSS